MKTRRAIIGLVALFGLAAGNTLAHDTVEGKGQLGKVSFQTSCDPKVQADFESCRRDAAFVLVQRGEKAFREVLEEGPECAIATWGIAAILMPIRWPGRARRRRARRGAGAIEQGRRIGARRSASAITSRPSPRTTPTCRTARSARVRKAAPRRTKRSPRSIRRTTRRRS